MFGLRSLQETREHTQSFYAATANTPTAYPALTDDRRADIVVVSGVFPALIRLLSWLSVVLTSR